MPSKRDRHLHRLLAARLKHAREERSIKQTDLANSLEVPQSFVSKYESGERMLDIFEVRSVCKLLDISLVDLLDWIDAKNSEMAAGGVSPLILRSDDNEDKMSEDSPKEHDEMSRGTQTFWIVAIMIAIASVFLYKQTRLPEGHPYKSCERLFYVDRGCEANIAAARLMRGYGLRLERNMNDVPEEKRDLKTIARPQPQFTPDNTKALAQRIVRSIQNVMKRLSE